MPITFARIADKDKFRDCLDRSYHETFGQFEDSIAREFKSARNLLASPSNMANVSSLAYTCRLLISSVLVSGETISYRDANAICGEGQFNLSRVFVDTANSIRLNPNENAHTAFMEAFLKHLARVPSEVLDRVFNGEGIKDKLEIEVNRLELGSQSEVTFLVGPSASGKSYNAKASGLVASDVSMIIDGDIVRDSSSWFHWLVDEAASSLKADCPYERYDVWGMLETWFSSKKLKSGKVKKALQKFLQLSKVNIVRPETATKWGAHLQYLGPLAHGGLNTDILSMTAAGYNVKVHGFISPVATTKCSAWRRAWDSWKPYEAEGWDLAVRALLQVLSAHKDDGVGGSLVISFIDKFKSSHDVHGLTNLNWMSCAKPSSADGLQYGSKIWTVEQWSEMTETQLWSTVAAYKLLGR